MTTPRVLVCGSWDDGPGYPRARSLLLGLEASGCDVHLQRLPALFAGRRKLELVRQPWRWPLALVQWREHARRVSTQIRAAVANVAPDVVVVPYPGHLAVRDVRREFRGPIVLDLFLSAHDTAVIDRQLYRDGSFLARRLRALDERACAAADLVLLDTPQHAAHVAATYAPRRRVDWLPVSDPDAPATAHAWRNVDPRGPLRLLFVGTGVPLHGLDILVDAVQRCAGAVLLEVIGGSAHDRATIMALRSPHILLGPEFVPREEIDRALARAHLVAGVFGTSAKAQRVVPFKVVHALAAGRPVVSGATPALAEFLVPGRDAVVAPCGDAAALAQTLTSLAAEPARLDQLASAARAAYDRCFAVPALAERWRGLLATLLDRSHADVPQLAHV